jgi:hypothetical protein
MCAINDIHADEQLVRIFADCNTSFHVCIKLDRQCRLQNSLTVEAEAQALIFLFLITLLIIMQSYAYMGLLLDMYEARGPTRLRWEEKP